MLIFSLFSRDLQYILRYVDFIKKKKKKHIIIFSSVNSVIILRRSIVTLVLNVIIFIHLVHTAIKLFNCTVKFIFNCIFYVDSVLRKYYCDLAL